MATPTRTLRLKPRLRDEIERIARRSRRSFSEVTQDLLDEALRMRACPGIYFADEPAGREAKIGGTGLGVWEVIRDYKAERTRRAFRAALPQLSDAQIKAALVYYERHRDEIDDAIADNITVARQGLRAQPATPRRRG